MTFKLKEYIRKVLKEDFGFGRNDENNNMEYTKKKMKLLYIIKQMNTMTKKEILYMN